MWFFFLSGRRKAERQVDEGVFPCPSCKTYEPCVRINLENQQTVYGLSLGAGQLLAELIQCKSCHRKFRADQFVKQAGSTAFEVQTWECPKCKGANPNHVYRCQHCAYSLV